MIYNGYEVIEVEYCTKGTMYVKDDILIVHSDDITQLIFRTSEFDDAIKILCERILNGIFRKYDALIEREKYGRFL